MYGIGDFNRTFGVILMDSQAVRDIAQTIRDRKERSHLNRAYIRTIISGIGKSICGRMESSFLTLDAAYQKMDLFRAAKIREFLQVSETWTGNSDEDLKECGGQKMWSKSYWDNHTQIPFMKVDSHQLNLDGTAIKSNPRYVSMVPNLFLLSCNHHADKCAEIILSPNFREAAETSAISLPDSDLRFIITWNGLGIDKHVSDFVHLAIQRERLRRLRTKPTQGLPCRIIKDSKSAWDEIRTCKRLFQSLRGFTRTHTQSLYKSTIYRMSNIDNYLLSQKVAKINTDIVKSKSNAQWDTLLAPCTWCSNSQRVHGNRYHHFFFAPTMTYKRFANVCLHC